MTRRISRGAKSRAPRKPALLPALLRALDARPDVTVVTREWPVLFIRAVYVLDKTVQNPDGFSPLHRETPRIMGQAFQLMKMGQGALLHPVPNEVCTDVGADVMGPLDIEMLPMHPEIEAKLGLVAKVERLIPLTGRPMER